MNAAWKLAKRFVWLWGAITGVLAAFIALGGLPMAVAQLAPYTPVFWNQLTRYIDGRATVRDSQLVQIEAVTSDKLDAINAGLLDNRIATLCAEETVLFVRQRAIIDALKVNPNDVVAGQDQQTVNRQIQDEQTARHKDEGQLQTLRHEIAASTGCSP